MQRRKVNASYISYPCVLNSTARTSITHKFYFQILIIGTYLKDYIYTKIDIFSAKSTTQSIFLPIFAAEMNRGARIARAEIIPIEPETDNAETGNRVQI